MIISKILPTWSLDPYYESSAVLDSILTVFKQHFLLDKKCTVEHTNNINMCCPKRNNKGQLVDYRIMISAESLDWSLTIYQLAHEISHAIMECYPDKKKFKWISECLCGSASLFVLDELSFIWQKAPYSENFLLKKEIEGNKILVPYVFSLREYFSNKIRKIEKVSSINDFYIKNASWLENDPCADVGLERPRNDVFALFFYDIIKSNPQGWKAILYMSDELLPEDANITDYLNHWYNKCTTISEKDFVLSLINCIGT